MARKKRPYPTRRFLPRFLLLLLLALVAGTWLLQNNAQNPLAILQPTISQTEFAQTANQKLQEAALGGSTVPLILQTDERWQEAAYGTDDGENTLALNGCALASLAMVLGYWEQREVPPTEILDWAQNNYYVTGAGTSWLIFADFAAQYNLQYQDLGNDLATAESYLAQGIPVVVSVTAGDFTDNGHIMVLRNWSEAGIQVNDPNDTPQKSHYQQTYQPSDIAQQAINYWVYQG